MLLNRQKSHANGILTGCRQFNSEGSTLADEKLVRNLNQDSGAVSGFRIAAACAAVRQIDQHLNSLFDDLMTLLAANAGYKAHPAGVVLVRRVIETLARRQSVLCLPKLQWNSP